MREKAAGGNGLHLEVLGIDQDFVILVEAARTGMVEIGGELLVEGLVRALMVVLVAPAFEAALLGAECRRGRTGRPRL